MNPIYHRVLRKSYSHFGDPECTSFSECCDYSQLIHPNKFPVLREPALQSGWKTSSSYAIMPPPEIGDFPPCRFRPSEGLAVNVPLRVLEPQFTGRDVHDP